MWKASKWVEMPKKTIENSTKPEKVLRLRTLSKPSPRNLFGFAQNLKTFRRKTKRTLGFHRKKTEREGLVRNLFRFCTKPKKVLWRRFRECAQEKNHSRFRRVCLISFNIWTHIKAFWHLPNLFGQFEKNLIYLEYSFIVDTLWLNQLIRSILISKWSWLFKYATT